jgi:glyoxylase-like metal-dependent hydrolase (beta-lactamase superfamily II)
VHERGAPHLIDPSKLVASAARLYGGEEGLRRIWGEVIPVPERNVRILSGGERDIESAYRVEYTPGHASHHVSYLHESSGRAFTGDVAGVRIDGGVVLAPTPPPDIDLDAWRASIGLIEGWRPRSLAVTHFGAYEDVAEQLSALRAHLDQVERWAEQLEPEGFVEKIRERVRAGRSLGTPGAYAQALPPEQSYAGLRRWLSRRDAQ